MLQLPVELRQMSDTANTIVAHMRHVRATRYGAFIPVALAIAVIWIYFGFSEPAFFSARNLYFLLMQSAVVGTLAVGITVVLLTGDIDLSAAANAGVCAALLAVLTTNHGVSAPVAIILALGTGALLGMFQGFISARVGIPSFVVTLAGLLAFQGLMLKVLGIHGAINVGDPLVRAITTFTFPKPVGWGMVIVCVALFVFFEWRNRLARLRLGLETEALASPIIKIGIFAVLACATIATLNSYRGLPLVVVLLFGLTGILAWITTSTPFGRAVFAVGGNVESARRSGISVNRVRVAAFGIVGFMAACGGIIGASRYASVSFNAFAGGSLLLEAIGAAVIGGTSLFGGHGSVWNALLGALVISSLGNGLDLSGASPADKFMFSGAILLLAVSIDALTRVDGTS